MRANGTASIGLPDEIIVGGDEHVELQEPPGPSLVVPLIPTGREGVME